MGYIGQAPTKIPLTSADITDGTIALADMAANSVDSPQYVDGSVDAVHLSANSVDSDSYVDASIDNAHLADDAVGVAELSATGTASSSTFLRGDNAWAAAGADTDLSNVSATGENKIAQAWVNFNGSAFAVRDSFNVSSVTDNGTGEYVVNIDTDLANINYATIASCISRIDDNYGIVASINSHSTSSLVRSLPATVGATGILTFGPRSNVPEDSMDVMAVCFGD